MADDNRSLSSGMSLPQWMKTRMNDREPTLQDILRLNYDQTTFSPPENDDSFLYIRYNRTSAANNATNSNGQFTPKIEVISKASSTVTSQKHSAADFSKHTAPCQQFIPNSNHTLSEAVKPLSGKVKSSGTDDGFKGEAAQCGSSVIRVAHQMVSGKFFKESTISEEFSTEPPGFNRSLRRGSKSLPTTPLTSPNSSPKTRRRHVNRYFANTTDAEKIQQGSWILSGLLKKHDNLSRSVNVINEEDGMNESLTKSVSQVSIDDVQEVAKTPKKNLKAKPSELREMNFWSPTSM